MKKWIASLLLIALLMTAVGCGAEEAEPTVTQTLPQQTEATVPSQPAQADGLTADTLRQQMASESKGFAVAYLGIMSSDCEDVWAYIDTLDGAILESIPFLRQIPATNVINSADFGEVYCILPADPNTTLEVYTGSEDMGYETLFYEGCGEDPYLLICNAEFVADNELCFVESNGERTYWSAQLDDYMYVDHPRHASGSTYSLDFSPYNEILLYYYAQMKGDGQWEVPTKADLEDTTWYWNGYTVGGNYFEYSVSFYADSADVRWNPGYGETCEYTDAQWNYEEGEISLLTMDFGEFAGVRKYNMLLNRQEGVIYIAVDATGTELYWDSEPQYRFMLQDQGGAFDPATLVGTWDRVQTEVEGDVQATPAGQVTVTITGTDETDLQITYNDRNFPDQNYTNKALTILTDGDSMGFGDVEWTAEVDHVGVYGQTYTLAIVEDTLVIRNYFEIDGAPAVSYETFRKAN